MTSIAGNEYGQLVTTSKAQKEALLAEIYLGIELYVHGVAFDPEELKQLQVGSEVSEQRHLLFDMNRNHQQKVALPLAFYLPLGSCVTFRWDSGSRYRLRVANGKPVLFKDTTEFISEVEFQQRPPVEGTTSDGTPFDRFGTFYPEGVSFLIFSNQCDLKSTGDDCKFCNINATADNYRDRNLALKSPKQLAEVYAAAFKAGYGNHLRLSGGFIPERREVEYYLDIADEIRDHTGQDEIHALTVIGAPADLSLIDKYREAGWTHLAINIEVWNKHIFEAICPGKSKRFGGREHWIDAMKHAVSVFGWGNVRSSMVGGLEPKESTLEGVEALASLGVVAFPGPWIPNPGSDLEGHRSPETSWHFDVLQKVAKIHAKHGFTTHQLFSCAGGRNYFADVFRINAGEMVDGRLPFWTFPDRRPTAQG